MAPCTTAMDTFHCVCVWGGGGGGGGGGMHGTPYHGYGYISLRLGGEGGGEIKRMGRQQIIIKSQG